VKILLAEDVDINREIVAALLEPMGIIVDNAENGEVAVEKFAASGDSYKMIFMDLQMPVMDGYEATRKIRAIEKTQLLVSSSRIPIIAMTANVFKEDIEKCLAAGMDSHVGKPLEMNELRATLRQYLG
jgi:CheY-like chemotaxis protein